MLRVCGIAVPVIDPINAAVLAVIATIVGLLPLTFSRGADLVTLTQRALVGTVLHVLIAVAMAVTIIATHSGSDTRQLIFWVFGGYLISLLLVVFQSRRLLVAAMAATGSKTKAN